MLNLAITGVAGRMGRTLVEAIASAPGVQLSAAIQRPESSILGLDAGELVGVGKLGVPIVATPDQAEFDCLVDFTLTEPSMQYLDYCQRKGKNIVIGTTGFSSDQLARIESARAEIPVLLAPNTSVGVNLCFALLKQAAMVLGDDVDIEIMESHHRNKIDAPSGTAVRMGELIADSLGRDLQECAVYGREGLSGPRDRNTIGFATTRAGDIVGEHTVMFAGEGERVEISHKSSNRMTFANGAIRAAKWLANQQPGFYDMQDVLGLK